MWGTFHVLFLLHQSLRLNTLEPDTLDFPISHCRTVLLHNLPVQFPIGPQSPPTECIKVGFHQNVKSVTYSRCRTSGQSSWARSRPGVGCKWDTPVPHQGPSQDGSVPGGGVRDTDRSRRFFTTSVKGRTWPLETLRVVLRSPVSSVVSSPFRSSLRSMSVTQLLHPCGD